MCQVCALFSSAISLNLFAHIFLMGSNNVIKSYKGVNFLYVSVYFEIEILPRVRAEVTF